jgi:hypothetical protein
MNKKINTTLILLLVGLIISMGIVNATGENCTCQKPEDFIITVNHDSPHLDPGIYNYYTLKPGETIKTKAYPFFREWEIKSWHYTFLSHTPLIFTLTNSQNELITEQIIETGKAGWICDDPAIFQYNTTNLPLGKYTLKITYNHPKCLKHPHLPIKTTNHVRYKIK